ncbi:MAG: hypothetical protein M5R42_06045 [Rhodocyclaceae bacterium]|nr:hypothetical protein [Rhodocyclaceae bacterium]
MIRRTFVQLVAACAFLAAGAPAALAGPAKQGVVIQVSDGDPKTWNQALNVVKNIQGAYGKDKVDVELVVFGYASGMLSSTRRWRTASTKPWRTACR